ncbi:hypothetical protein [uncultured Chloroflexus sp.]|uniref:hypothetical protein n=1 Tax=uncultured Chloroflexus sp. TaxID=214040 RepID=UPI0026187480|nr:hypothetical protein [uncultured Chloroflexus sp.]
MSFHNRRHPMLFLFLGLIWFCSWVVQPVAAQSEIIMYVFRQVRSDGNVIVEFSQLPVGFNEVRWRWNEPPTDADPWQPIVFVYAGYGNIIIQAPPDTGVVCQQYELHAQIRDQGGNLISLQGGFFKDNSVDVQINLVTPQRAMSGYTNQDTILVSIIGDNECAGLRDGGISIDQTVLYIFEADVPDRYEAEYPLPAVERPISLSMALFDRVSNVVVHDVSIVRDVTPPTLADIRATATVVEDGTRLTITGQFNDAHAPLPWAVEWQFVTSDGVELGEPVYHVLEASEVQAGSAATLAATSTPFGLNVLFEAPPQQASALRIQLFDRAGNGRAIDPVMITSTVSHTVYVPLVGR